MVNLIETNSNIGTKPMHRIDKGTIWGGYQDANLHAQTGAITASIYSGAANGGKGGDIYYFSVCNGDMLSRIVIGDVVGHGESVSKVSSWLYEALLKRLNICGEHNVLAELNSVAMEKGLSALTTMASVSYYLANRQLHVSYAGHPPAFVLRNGNHNWEVIQMQSNDCYCNIPLGISETAKFDSMTISLNSGDRVLLYTDGVLEAQDQDKQFYGEQRLLDVLNTIGAKDPQDIKDCVIRSLQDYSGPVMAHDDVTLIALSIN